MRDYSDSWAGWESLLRRRNNDPIDAAKEFLRSQGWIVERPETLSLSVKVARSGSLDSKDGFRITLHTRVNVGGRLLQADTAIDARHAEALPSRAFVGAVSTKIQRAIMAEIEPDIQAGFERELEKAKREAHD